jgi:hypothetical protein
LRWLVVIVVTYVAITMLWSATRAASAVRSSATA